METQLAQLTSEVQQLKNELSATRDITESNESKINDSSFLTIVFFLGLLVSYFLLISGTAFGVAYPRPKEGFCLEEVCENNTQEISLLKESIVILQDRQDNLEIEVASLNETVYLLNEQVTTLNETVYLLSEQIAALNASLADPLIGETYAPPLVSGDNFVPYVVTITLEDVWYPIPYGVATGESQIPTIGANYNISETGVYWVFYQTSVGSTGNQARMYKLAILVNNMTMSEGMTGFSSETSNDYAYTAVSAYLSLNAGDIVSFAIMNIENTADAELAFVNSLAEKKGS